MTVQIHGTGHRVFATGSLAAISEWLSANPRICVESFVPVPISGLVNITNAVYCVFVRRPGGLV